MSIDRLHPSTETGAPPDPEHTQELDAKAIFAELNAPPSPPDYEERPPAPPHEGVTEVSEQENRPWLRRAITKVVGGVAAAGLVVGAYVGITGNDNEENKAGQNTEEIAPGTIGNPAGEPENEAEAPPVEKEVEVVPEPEPEPKAEIEFPEATGKIDGPWQNYDEFRWIGEIKTPEDFGRVHDAQGFGFAAWSAAQYGLEMPTLSASSEAELANIPGEQLLDGYNHILEICHRIYVEEGPEAAKRFMLANTFNDLDRPLIEEGDAYDDPYFPTEEYTERRATWFTAINEYNVDPDHLLNLGPLTLVQDFGPVTAANDRQVQGQAADGTFVTLHLWPLLMRETPHSADWPGHFLADKEKRDPANMALLTIRWGMIDGKE